MHRGIVKGFRRNHHQDIDGILLEDGTDVRFPPHVGHQIEIAISIGEPVTIEGQRKTKPRGEVVFEARRIEAVKETIEITRPKAHHPLRTVSPEERMSATGKLVEYHFNRHGELDGFRLDDKTEVKFPPHLSSVLERCAAVGDMVLVEGRWHESPKGDVHLHADRIANQKTNKSVNRHESMDSESGTNSHPSNADIMQELKEIRGILERFTELNPRPKSTRKR